jgi:hypothetical protein
MKIKNKLINIKKVAIKRSTYVKNVENLMKMERYTINNIANKELKILAKFVT